MLAERGRQSDVPVLSDPLALDVANGRGHLAVRRDAGSVSAIAQLSGGPVHWQLQTVVADAATVELVAELAAEALAAADLDGASGATTEPTVVDWWVFGDDEATGAAARRLGFVPDRELFLMTRALPTEQRADVTTRAFVPGVDDEAWIAVNNRAFAGHGEQGGWTAETLRQRIEAPWFVADGFRLYEHDGELLGFCWTKLHASSPGSDEPAGEIYVIGIDPSAHGRGLGRQLTQSGLDWIADQGITSALLYVAADNAAAVGLYRSMGFAIHRRDRAYRRTR